MLRVGSEDLSWLDFAPPALPTAVMALEVYGTITAHQSLKIETDIET